MLSCLVVTVLPRWQKSINAVSISTAHWCQSDLLLIRSMYVVYSLCCSFYCLKSVIGYTPPPDGLSLWLVRRCGILCRTTCTILVLAETNSDYIGKRLYSLRTGAYSTLEVLRLCAIDIDIGCSCTTCHCTDAVLCIVDHLLIFWLESVPLSAASSQVSCICPQHCPPECV